MLCGLVIELCYRLCYRLLGSRRGRVFWFVSSWLGAPVHELGHAAMCLLFAHRIEHIRLFSTSRGNAMVEHSYNRRNPYATFGNLWISLGPIFSCLGVIIALSALVFPAAVDATWQQLSLFLEKPLTVGQLYDCLETLILTAARDSSHPIVARIAALAAMLATALHVRLSTADILGMLPAMPVYLTITALISLIVTLIGGKAHATLQLWLLLFAKTMIFAFAMILLLALALLVLVVLYRLIALMFHCLLASPQSN